MSRVKNVGGLLRRPASFQDHRLWGSNETARVEECMHSPSASLTKNERRTAVKGNKQVIERLNARLADELAAINQYMVHSEMCEDWGYGRLHELIEKRAIEEMKHAEALIGRILFLEGHPTVSKLSEIHIGEDIEAQYKNDWAAENQAIKDYNDDIRFAMEQGDYGTHELLGGILKDEEEHIDWIEAQLGQIEQIGIKNYLVEQIE
jgi:bacterioferritin